MGNSSFDKKYYDLEQTHWWFVARRDIIFRILKRIVKKESKILDIGCSNGVLLKSLEHQGYANIYGVDINNSAINYCITTGLKTAFCMDGAHLNFSDNEFDIIIASDVLEHIDNDKSALKEWLRVLKPGGKLIVFVPAFNFLWSNHDILNQHYRRYSKKVFVKTVTQAGFEIKKVSYWNFLLFFPIFVMRKVFKLIPKTVNNQLFKLPNLMNIFLINVIKLENVLLQNLNFPVGVSIFILAEKPGVISKL